MTLSEDIYQIPLWGSAGKVGIALIDADDAALIGALRWNLMKNGYAIASKRAGSRTLKLLMHRLITGNPDGMVVDHINHQRLDNRRVNLRICCGSQNAKNQRHVPGKTKGVRSIGNTWEARIAVDGHRIHLGCFKSQEEAHSVGRRRKDDPGPIGPEEAKKILAERWRLDPCRAYKAIPSFQKVIECIAPNQCLESANQMGKSSLLQWTAACLARGIHPSRPSYGPTRGLVIVPKRSHAVDWASRLTERCALAGSLAHLGSIPYIPAYEITHITPAHGSNMGKYAAKIEMKDGSEIFFALSGDDRSWKTIEGWTFDWIIRDEFAGSENMGVTIGRGLLACRSNAAKPLGGLYLWATTSTDPNEEWETFRDNAKAGVPGHAYFTADWKESNDYVSIIEREKWAANMSEEQKAVRAFGGSSAATSLFIYRRHIDEYEERLCRDLAYQPLPSDNLVVCYDPGWKDPCGILCGYITKERPETVILTHFLHYRHGTRLDHVQSIREWADGRLITWFICDPAIQKTESNGVSFFITFCEDLAAAKVKTMGTPIKGRNRNEDGIPLVEDYLLEKNPGQTLVFDMAGEGIQAGVNQLRQYRWRQNHDNTVSKITYVSKTQRDEFCDLTKYLTSRRPRWMDNGPQYRLGDAIPVAQEAALTEKAAYEKMKGLISNVRL